MAKAWRRSLNSKGSPLSYLVGSLGIRLQERSITTLQTWGSNRLPRLRDPWLGSFFGSGFVGEISSPLPAIMAMRITNAQYPFLDLALTVTVAKS